MTEIIDGIVQDGHPILRKRARDIPPDEISSENTKKVLSEMQKALISQFDGVAIAAPQIGEPLRIFVVSKQFLEEYEKSDVKEVSHKIFINPIITKRSKRRQWMEEGCLSVRWKYGEVRRSTTVTIRALDEEGRVFTHTGSGIIAQIFQHEIDHLEGILFTDGAKNVRDIDPAILEEAKKQKYE